MNVAIGSADLHSLTTDSILGNNNALAFGRVHLTIAADANYTVPLAEYRDGVILEADYAFTGAHDIILPVQDGAIKIVFNNTGQAVTYKAAAGTGVTVAAGKRASIYCNATDWVRWSPDV